MKNPQTLIEGLDKLKQVSTAGEVRHMIAIAIMAKLRGELSDSTLLSVAKSVDSMANLLNTEIKVARAQIELRDKGGQLGNVSSLGALPIGDTNPGITPSA